MKIIAVRGIKGGVGSTTVAAHIATALALQRQSVLAIDFCPQNHLRLYLGLPWNEDKGLISQLLTGEPWHRHCFKNDSNVLLIPFGNAFSGLSAKTDVALANFLPKFSTIIEDAKLLDLAADCWVVVDLGHHNQSHAAGGAQFEELINGVDLLLQVVNPDPFCYGMLSQLNIGQRQLTTEKILLNRFCPVIKIERDIHDLIQTEYAQYLAPTAIHLDENIRESLAFNQTALECAKYCQAAQDFHLLTTWIKAGSATRW